MTCKTCVTCRHLSLLDDKPMCRLGERWSKPDLVFGGKLPVSAYQMRANKDKCGPEAALWEAIEAPAVGETLSKAQIVDMLTRSEPGRLRFGLAALGAALVSGAGTVLAFPTAIGAAWDGLTARVHRAWVAFRSPKAKADPDPIFEPPLPGLEPALEPPIPEPITVPAEPPKEGEDVSGGSLIPFKKPEAPEDASGQKLALGVGVFAFLALLCGYMLPELLAASKPCGSQVGWNGESCCARGDDGQTRCRRCRQASL